MKRNQKYYREQRERAIKRKYRLQQKRLGRNVAKQIYDSKRLGQLDKGKIHCSCPMCRTKSYDELSHRDKIQKAKAQYQLTHLLED